MPNDNPYFFTQAQVAAAFNRAAAHYQTGAALALEVGKRMIERLDFIRIQPSLLLDLGCGIGLQIPALKRRYPKVQILAIDIAEHMLTNGRAWLPWWKKQPHWICASAQGLPLPDHSIDLLFANLTLAWCQDIAAHFSEWHRVLKPGGLMMFSTFGPDTLHELRTAWQAIDIYTHVHGFYDMHDIGDLLIKQRFFAPVMDMEHITFLYPDSKRLFIELKAAGMQNLTQGRRLTLTGKQRFAQLNKQYAAYHNPQGLLPATFEIIYGHAWKGEKTQHSLPNEISIPLSQVLKSKP